MVKETVWKRNLFNCFRLRWDSLKDDKTISPYSKEIISKAKAAGHIVCIATGRPFRSSSIYYDELNLDTPIVNFNGAYVHHPKDDSWEPIIPL